MMALVLVVAYLVVGFLAIRSILLRMKAKWPKQPLDWADIAFAVVLGGLLWPIGWPTSFSVLPSLHYFKHGPRRPRKSRVINDWAERTLARKEIVP
jgi:hypothetical protein